MPSKGTCPKIQVKTRPKVAHKVPLVKAEKLCSQIKVGLADYNIPCFNRFSPLDHLHTVIEPPSNAGICHDICNLTEVANPMASQDKANIKVSFTNQHKYSSDGSVSGTSTSLTYQDQNPITSTDQGDSMDEESSDSKYDLPLRIKTKVSTYKQVLPNCPTLQAWDKQNKFKFGFIPLGTSKVPDKCQLRDSSLDPLLLH